MLDVYSVNFLGHSHMMDYLEHDLDFLGHSHILT